MSNCRLLRSRILQFLLVAVLTFSVSNVLFAERPNAKSKPDLKWIWVPVHEAADVPQGAAGFFRKSFETSYPTSAILEIAADDVFEVTLNSKRVGRGDQWRHFTRFDVTPLLKEGKNVLAVKVVNQSGKTAGLVAKLMLGDGRTFVTDQSWKCSTLSSARWRLANFSEQNWRDATELGKWGSTEPWIVTPLPSARRLPPTNSITKPTRVQHEYYPDDSKVVLAAYGQPDSANKAKKDTSKPKTGPPAGGLFAPLQKRFPWLNHQGNSRKPAAKSSAVAIPNNHVHRPPSSTTGVSPREITNPHVAPSNAGIAAPTNQNNMVPRPKVDLPDPVPPSPSVSNLPSPQASIAPHGASSPSSPATPQKTKSKLVDVSERFTMRDGFAVQQLLDSEATGSLITATFNEFGQLLVGRENGPLMVVEDSDDDRVLDQVRPYCEKVKNCQGILALSGMVFVIAEGSEGTGLYRLSDDDRDGELEEAILLAGFDVTSKEHGPHGIVLGPEGKLYITVGNHAKIQEKFSQHSPRRHLYEGDLIKRYEDPTGHAQGVKIPAGFILRTDINGKKLELFASGLRNAYDLAFNSDGQLFTYDSDMESDQGTNWYRPTRVYHTIPGSEFGWRSGWAKWPSYYLDVVPPAAETGRGSPTGMEFYQHYTYPKDYHDVAFLGDWSEGRILTGRLKENGASYSMKTETFLEGTPLNVTDLAVGPDGLLYFVTGGRGTQGGIYRVAWTGRAQRAPSMPDAISMAVYAPQVNSSWGRQGVAAIKQRMGKNWNSRIVRAVKNDDLPVDARVQALQLMQWVGPMPEPDLLIDLSKDPEYKIRRASSYLMSLVEDERLPLRQLELLGDPHPVVRRQACEALVRGHRSVPFEYVAPLLKSEDRSETWAARRLLALDDPQEWLPQILETDDVRLFLQASTALMTAWPSKEHATVVAERAAELMSTYITDRDFVDMIRMLQIAVLRGELEKTDVPRLVATISEEFPANGHRIMNRELMRLLAKLNVTSIKDRYLEHLESGLADEDRIHLVIHLCAMDADWTSGEKMRLMKFMQAPTEAGTGVTGYLQNVARDFGKRLDPSESYEFIRDGADNPSAALTAVMRLPEKLTSDQIQDLVVLDQSISIEDNITKRLKVAIMAVLARDGRDSSMAYIRRVFDDEPTRRMEATIALAEQPGGENWPYLVRALPLLEGNVAREILIKLITIDRSPKEAEAYRQVILLGNRLGDNGGDDAIRLLEHWQGFASNESTPPWNEAIKAWQTWYSRTYPDAPSASEITTTRSKWDYHKLLRHLNNPNIDQIGDVERGGLVFEKAQCAKCHRHGAVGEHMGPNLSTIGKRFVTKEIIDSIIYPSRVISDQYKAKTLVTDDGQTYTGIIGDGGEGELVVLKLDGEKIRIAKDSIEQTIPSKLSAMPEGLLNDLTLQDVTDLLVFLRKTPIEQISEGSKPGVSR